MLLFVLFLEHYDENINEFFNHIVTVDETWIPHYSSETGIQEYHHSKSLTKPNIFKQTPSTQKIMTTVFWDRKGVFLVELLCYEVTLNVDVFWVILTNLRQTTQNCPFAGYNFA